MGQRRVDSFPLSGAWLREACLRCWNATYSWRSLFETVLMALGFCSVVCVRWKRRLYEESSCLSGAPPWLFQPSLLRWLPWSKPFLRGKRLPAVPALSRSCLETCDFCVCLRSDFPLCFAIYCLLNRCGDPPGFANCAPGVFSTIRRVFPLRI
ncbi:hypothetical protein NPIL_574221 [Nephila pilipes]|uniref:Uncharacterized protein n=1 Tax=Nephila pilipes TaxID=299642 RepID=A0A8X6MPR8_NEPPI|nr:hypothetical protein NPIL_574221 [Nephila pilipes]